MVPSQLRTADTLWQVSRVDFDYSGSYLAVGGTDIRFANALAPGL